MATHRAALPSWNCHPGISRPPAPSPRCWLGANGYYIQGKTLVRAPPQSPRGDDFQMSHTLGRHRLATEARSSSADIWRGGEELGGRSWSIRDLEQPQTFGNDCKGTFGHKDRHMERPLALASRGRHKTSLWKGPPFLQSKIPEPYELEETIPGQDSPQEKGGNS